MAQNFIADPETGRWNVAFVRNGEVFRDDKGGARIATIINAHVYDLGGNSLGRLGANGDPLPPALKEFLERESLKLPPASP